MIEIVCDAPAHYPPRLVKLTAFDRIDGEWEEVGEPGVRLAKPPVEPGTMDEPDMERVRNWLSRGSQFPRTGRPSPAGGTKYEMTCRICGLNAQKRHENLTPMLDQAETFRAAQLPIRLLGQ